MEQPPQGGGPSDEVDTTRPQQEGIEQAGTGSCIGGQQEQGPDAPLSPVPSAQLPASIDTTATTGGSGIPEEESNRRKGQGRDPDAPLSPVPPAQAFTSGDITAITGGPGTSKGDLGEKDPHIGNATSASSLRATSNVQGAAPSTGGGGDQEQDLDASTSPVQPTRLFVSGDNTTADDPGTLQARTSGTDHRHNPSTAASSIPTGVPAEAEISTGSGPEGLEGGIVEGDPHIDHPAATVSLPTAGPAATGASTGGGSGGGGSGDGGGDGNSATPPPGGSDVELDSLFGRLRVEPEGGTAAGIKDDNGKDEEQSDSLQTKIEDLEMYLKIETVKRLQAEHLAQQFETELHRTSDRCDTEIAAREQAESTAKHFASLFAEAQTAWRKTQNTVQNKERELTAAEAKLRSESSKGGDDAASLERRLEDARKDKEVFRQHSATLKLALEGGSVSPFLRSPAAAGMAAAFAVAADLPADAGEPAAGSVNGDRDAADDENVAVTIPTNAEHRMADTEQTEMLSSPNPKLEGDRKAAAEARLEVAIAEAGRRQLSKKITAPVLLEQKARLRNIQQQQRQQQQRQQQQRQQQQKTDHAELSPRCQQAVVSTNSQLSPSAPSYFPPSITAAALHKAREQHDSPKRQKDNNSAMPLLDLDCGEEPSAAGTGNIGDGGQILFAAPSPATMPIAGVDFFPEPPLPPRPGASPATDERREAGRDGDGEGSGLGLDDTGSPVRLVLPPLSFSDLPAGSDAQPSKGAEGPQTQPRTESSPAAFHQELEEIYISDEEGQPKDAVGPLTQMLASSSIGDAGWGTGTAWPEDGGGGKRNTVTPRDDRPVTVPAGVATPKAATPKAATPKPTTSSYGTQGRIGGGTLAMFDGVQENATAATMPPLGAGNGGGCSGAEGDKENRREAGENNDDDTGKGEEKDDVVRRAGRFLQALENEGYMKGTMATLEVDLGMAVSVVSERKFLDLHGTKGGVGQLLAALDSPGLAL